MTYKFTFSSLTMFSGEVPIFQNICHIQKEAEVFALVLADCSLWGWDMKTLRVRLRSSQFSSAYFGHLPVYLPV